MSLKWAVAVGSGVNASMDYDPVGRLSEVTGSGVTTKFVYSGSQMIAETNSSGTTLRRYVHGPGVDEPIVWYEGATLSDRRWLLSDNQGSITAITNSTGAVTAKNRYNEYGVPDTANTGRFQYTGQVWLAEADIYHYKARAYDPYLGRFLQTDPIGYADGMNMYAYVGGDPVNYTDPSGLKAKPDPCAGIPNCVTAKRQSRGISFGSVQFTPTGITNVIDGFAFGPGGISTPVLPDDPEKPKAKEDSKECALASQEYKMAVNGAFESALGDLFNNLPSGSGGDGGRDNTIGKVISAFRTAKKLDNLELKMQEACNE